MDGSSVVKLLVAGVGLAELPPRRRHVQELYVLPAGASDGEAERLASEPRESLPISAPVSRHLDPPGVGALEGKKYRLRNSEISDISRLPVGPGILLLPPKNFGILKLCAPKIGPK
jgi:hypothetical protein